MALPENETSRIKSLTDLRILDTSPEQIFDDLAGLAALICDTPIAIIDFVDAQRVWLKAKIGLEVNEVPREESFSTYAIQQSDVLLVLDPLSDARFANGFMVRDMGIRFYAGIPITSNGGYAVGTLAVMDRITHLITAEQIDSLKILARRIVHELAFHRTVEGRSPQPKIHLAPTLRRPACILLVEDNDNLRNLLQRTLEGSGFSVLSASDGAEALGMSDRHDGVIDMTVTDIVMPRLNGLRMTERIRAARPAMRFLFITGFPDEVRESGELIETEWDVLRKPFLPSELVAKVETMLDQDDSATGTDD